MRGGLLAAWRWLRDGNSAVVISDVRDSRLVSLRALLDKAATLEQREKRVIAFVPERWSRERTRKRA